jgi:uncharacterized protein (DUF1810 family)
MTSMNDRFNLARFVDAQEHVYDQVRSELRDGLKRSHWMWFVFPQIQGLGFSPMAERYAISSLDEAKAYLRHPVLGARLRECTELVAKTEGLTLHQIFGHPDNLKFRSCMTLFANASGEENPFAEVLKKFGQEYDRMTLERLGVRS